VLEHKLSEDEHSQILQTIEMFEAITQTQPDDYQSLEILKEAYFKVGRQDESMKISRRLAEAYFNVGSFTQAMQECEVILLKEPSAPDILAMLGEIESRLQASGQMIAASSALGGLTVMPNYASNGNGAGKSSLMELSGRNSALKGKREAPQLGERGDDHLAKFLIMQQIFPEDEVNEALATVNRLNKDLAGQALAISLLDHLCKDNEPKMEKVLSGLLDRTKFAYVPLEYYDVDRHVVRMLGDNLTLGRLIVPFDLISRTIMVAICNPFDAAGREAVQQSLDYNVMWYLARPSALNRVLQDIYRLDARA
jgi:tetratricopeptide (TPR) repeat protein